jgi:predicted phage terminase large subunit-like protein
MLHYRDNPFATEGMKALALLVRRAERGKRVVTEEQLQLVDQLRIMEARESFWAFRCYINPKLKLCWWHYDASLALQDWWEAYKRGERPTLVVQAPPQHGKTTMMQDFLAWCSGHNPDIKSIYASFSDALGIETNKAMQRIYSNPAFQRVFPELVINAQNVVTMLRAARNSQHIDYIDREGSFRNTTVNGVINGFGLDIGLIDDPMKGRVATQSKTIRDNTWSWFTSDFFARFSDHAGLIIIMTRWHVDDPVGRFIEMFPDTVVKIYKAIATEDEEYRAKGEPLFPEHKSLAFLLLRKKALAAYEWESLYQQSPIIVGGDLFKVEGFKLIDAQPYPRNVIKSVRYWDKAGTEGGGAYTCGVLMHLMDDDTCVVSDVVRGQWSALKREERMRQTAQLDDDKWGVVAVWVEQEPGSGGKESAERSIMNLRGHDVHADRVTGDKEVRARPYAAQVEAGNIKLVRAPWNKEFIAEHETFPAGKYKDQVDSAGGAFAKVAIGGSSYDESLSWVDN